MIKKIIIIAGFLIFLLIFYFSNYFYKNINQLKGPYFTVLPHHLITRSKIDEFYKFISSKHKDINKIIIISPDHYNSGGGFAKGVFQDGKICFLKDCVNSSKINGFVPHKDDFPLFYQSGSAFYTREHGIGIHFYYINKYFGQNNVVVKPFVIKREKDVFKRTDDIIKKINENEGFIDNNTLVISSVDFSHHTKENFALYHDSKTIESINFKDFKDIEVDCQNCLKLVSSLAEKYNKNYFNLFSRTSVDSILHVNSDIGNTSHIIGEFSDKKEISSNDYNENINLYDIDDSRIYGAFLGDIMFNRNLLINNKENDFFEKSLKEFFQGNDIKNNNKYGYHKKLYGFDFVGVNLETTILKNEKNCNSKKENNLTFVGDLNNLNLLKEIGINLFSISNNHTNDCGIQGYNETKENIKNIGLNSFDSNNFYEKTIRGIKTVFIGADDFSSKTNYDFINKKIKDYSKKGYKVIISIHWGSEYEKLHNKRQENIAHNFIDNGANIIIGHHPHILQDIEIYKGIPIIYSLGNFIFDQNITGTLEGNVLLFYIGKSKTDFNLVPFKRNEKTLEINFK